MNPVIAYFLRNEGPAPLKIFEKSYPLPLGEPLLVIDGVGMIEPSREGGF